MKNYSYKNQHTLIYSCNGIGLRLPVQALATDSESIGRVKLIDSSRCFHIEVLCVLVGGVPVRSDPTIELMYTDTHASISGALHYWIVMLKRQSHQVDGGSQGI